MTEGCFQMHWLRSALWGLLLFLPIYVTRNLLQKWHHIPARVKNGRGKQEAEQTRSDGFTSAKG